MKNIYQSNIKTEKLCNLFGFTEMKLDNLVKELINKEFPDLKSNNPVLYANTHALLSSILYYFDEFVDDDKCNVFSIIKVLNYYEFSDDNESSMIYNPILVKVKDIDGYEFFKSAFYYQIFEKICISLDVISVIFSILSNYVNDPNNLCNYEIISCSKEVLKLEEKLLKENDNKIESPYTASDNSKNNKYEARILMPRKNGSVFNVNNKKISDKIYQDNDIQSELARPEITQEEAQQLYKTLESIRLNIKKSLMSDADVTVVKNNNESMTYSVKKDENNHIIKDAMNNMQGAVDDLLETFEDDKDMNEILEEGLNDLNKDLNENLNEKSFNVTPEIKEELTKSQEQKIKEIFTENDIIQNLNDSDFLD